MNYGERKAMIFMKNKLSLEDFENPDSPDESFSDTDLGDITDASFDGFDVLSEMSDSLNDVFESYKKSMVGMCSRSTLKEKIDRLNVLKEQAGIDTRQEIDIDAKRYMSEDYAAHYAIEGVGNTVVRIIAALLKKIGQFLSFIGGSFKRMILRKKEVSKVADKARNGYKWANEAKIAEVAKVYDKLHKYSEDQIRSGFDKNAEQLIKALRDLKASSRLYANLTSNNTVQFDPSHISVIDNKVLSELIPVCEGIKDSNMFIKFIVADTTRANPDGSTQESFLSTEAFNKPLKEALHRIYSTLATSITTLTGQEISTGSNTSEHVIKIPMTNMAYHVKTTFTEAKDSIIAELKPVSGKAAGSGYLPLFTNRESAISILSKTIDNEKSAQTTLLKLQGIIQDCIEVAKKHLSAANQRKVVSANAHAEAKDYQSILMLLNSTLSVVEFIANYISLYNRSISTYMKSCSDVIDIVIPKLKAFEE